MKEKKLKALLGGKIKFYRLRRQFSQANLAEKANISITFLSNIERGNNYPQPGTLCNIAQALDVEIWELFKEDTAFDGEAAIIDRISADYSKQINNALATVYKKYRK